MAHEYFVKLDGNTLYPSLIFATLAVKTDYRISIYGTDIEGRRIKQYLIN